MIFKKGDKVVIPDENKVKYNYLLYNEVYTIHHGTIDRGVILEEDKNSIYYSGLFISVKEDRKRKINKLINKI